MTHIVLSFPASEAAHRHHFKEFSSTAAKSSANCIDWMANKEIQDH